MNHEKRAILLLFGLWFIMASVIAGVAVIGNLNNGGNVVFAAILRWLMLPIALLYGSILFAFPLPGLVAGQPRPPGYTARMNTIEAISIGTILIVGILLLFWFVWTYKAKEIKNSSNSLFLFWKSLIA